MKERKCYGGMILIHGKQYRAIVSARSRAEAARLTGVSPVHIRDYWAVTGNSYELSLASSSPGVVFVYNDPYGMDRTMSVLTHDGRSFSLRSYNSGIVNHIQRGT